MPTFKLQVQDDDANAAIWHDVKSENGQPLLFQDEGQARGRERRGHRSVCFVKSPVPVSIIREVLPPRLGTRNGLGRVVNAV